DDPDTRSRTAATWSLPDFSRIVVAGWLQELGQREFGVETTLINNAVDTDLFTAPPRQRNEEPTFGLMYHPRECTGADISIRAFELARERVPGIRLKAFGPEGEFERIPLPPGTPLQVQPPQREIASFYASRDAYLFGSRCEGFGLPILESMACRTPVIGTPTGAAPELIAEGGGRLVRMEDPESMAEAIVEIASMSPEAWRRMSDAAWETAQKHCWDRATDQFEVTLAEACGAPRDTARLQASMEAPAGSAKGAAVVAGT